MVEVNLIPESVQAAQGRRRHIKRGAVCVCVAAVVVATPLGFHWMQRLRVDELRAQSDGLEADLLAARTALQAATAQANDAKLRIERARALRSKRAWSNMLALIGACLPHDCFLTSIATDPAAPTAATAVRKGPQPPAAPSPSAQEKPAEPAVVTIEAPRKLRMTGESANATQPLVFVAKLKESQVFQNVTLERSSRVHPEDASQYRFELFCEW